MSKMIKPSEQQGAQETFVRYLRSHHIKYTKPRREIFEAVLQIQEHFEAEQLLVMLRQKGIRVAKATIYRTLPILVECGILKQVRFNDSQAHYEHAFGEDPHDHMVCRRCGRIIEFSNKEVEKLRHALSKKHGFHDVAHRFQISGLCEDCVRNCPVGTFSAGKN